MKKIRRWQELFEHRDGELTRAEIDAMFIDVFATFNRERAWLDAIGRVELGEHMVSAVLTTVFKRWPSTISGVTCVETVEHVSYNRGAPDVRALDIIRWLAGTRDLGAWNDTHGIDERVRLLRSAMHEDLKEEETW